MSCSIPITVQTINDHKPVVDLNGFNTDGINYTTSLTYRYQSLSNTSIAADSVHVIDNDSDATIVSMTVSLVSYTQGDRLVSIGMECTDPPTEGTCYIE